MKQQLYITITTTAKNYKSNHDTFKIAYAVISDRIHPERNSIKELSYEKARHLQALILKKYGKEATLINTVNMFDAGICYKKIWIYLEA